MTKWEEEHIRKLQEKYGEQYPYFSRHHWKLEVTNDDTTLGYWEWALHKITDELDPCHLLQELLEYEADAFSVNQPVHSGALADWFLQFRVKVKFSQEDYL